MGAPVRLRMEDIAKRFGDVLALDRVTLEVWHEKMHAADAALAADGTARIDRFTRVLQLDGDLDDEQRQRLLEIAGRCPVHRTLERSSHIETRLAPE